jgi:hypothetical protein
MDKEKRWRKFQERLGYTDQELAIIRSNPKFVKCVEETPEFMTHRIVATVVYSHGCHAQHMVGQRIVMDGNGYFIRDECPPRMCIFALVPISYWVQAIYEKFLNKQDPNDLLFKRFSCMDVGPECGGWGRIILEISVEAPKGK